MPSDIGSLRRSSVASTFGPGAVVDFRAGSAPVSAVIAGLEEWDLNFPPAGPQNPQTIREVRLQQRLGVSYFRLPPVTLGRHPGMAAGRKEDRQRLIGVRFPKWLQCPSCDRIADAKWWAAEPGRAGRACPKCTQERPGRRPVYAIPLRFILACEHGHLDDFPWHAWVGHKKGCNVAGFLSLRSEHPGLGGLIVSCSSCGARRSMDGVFNKETWKTWRCSGDRPWLGTRDTDCDGHVRAMQRGASNLYFPVVESALSIPPWSDQLQEALGTYWGDLINTEAADRAQFVRFLRQSLQPTLDNLQMTPQQLADEIERRVKMLDTQQRDDLRVEEFRQFTTGAAGSQAADREFEIRREPVPDKLAGLVASVVRVVRLREVRAIRGFTRINPPDGGEEEIVPIARTRKDWLPAIEVRGEGIFLRLEERAVSAWEQGDVVRTRAATLDGRLATEWERRYGDASTRRPVTARFLLIHALAHALMRQLTLSCGYSSAALRERLYVSEDSSTTSGMAGLLIYTATTDADGTLGGLQREGMSDRLRSTFGAAIEAMEWCSSDPLCIEDAMATTQGLSLAACHACLLAPETSCEEFNMLLDRVMLIGTPTDPGAGFFRQLLGDFA